MRDALKNITESDYWVYGLSESDFEFTVRLTSEAIERQVQALRLKAERTRAEQPEMADDILDDVLYYGALDLNYLWHFCLWRLQAVFEGIIKYTFLPAEKRNGLNGLQRKLQAMRRLGYSLSQADFDELILWGRVRNTLSHAPPEEYRPGPLAEADVWEYKTLVERLCAAWRAEIDTFNPNRGRKAN